MRRCSDHGPYVDNNFILGIGAATRVSGQLDHAPAVTPFQQLPVIGGTSTGIGEFPITVHFRSAGTYPFEVDYLSLAEIAEIDSFRAKPLAHAG
jgi:hypothetical protein